MKPETKEIRSLRSKLKRREKKNAELLVLLNRCQILLAELALQKIETLKRQTK